MITKNNINEVGRSGFVSKLVISSLFLMSCMTGFAKDFPIDKSASTLEWEAKKVTGQHNGTVSFSEGTLNVEKKKITGGKFTVDMTTIVNTDGGGPNERLVGHLKSDDFFGVEKFPQSTLVVTKAESKAGNTYHFTADLTIKGITKPVEFDAEVSEASGVLTATGVMTVNRAKYDIKFRSASFFSDLGDKMIYDDFSLKFKLVTSIK
jgi:polyisoprenoid-binding protein YceI